MKKTITVIALALLAFAGCRQKDVRDFEIEVPALGKSAEVERDVKGALSACVGIEMATVKIDAEKRRVALKYDSMQTAKKNIEMAIAQAGYTANGVTPESIAAKSKEK